MNGSSASGACKVCRAWANKGKIEIPYGKTIEEVLGPDWEPPYHPNCNCRAEIEYYDDRNFVTRETWEELKAKFTEILRQHNQGRMHGVPENILHSLKILDDWLRSENVDDRLKRELDIITRQVDELGIRAYAKYARSCLQRAEELKQHFDAYLRVRGITGVAVEVQNVSLVHAWVACHATVLGKNGTLVHDYEIYDPWTETDGAYADLQRRIRYFYERLGMGR